MGALFRAVVGAHFHLAQIYAGEDRPGYAVWAEGLERARAGRCRFLARVPSLQDAVAIVEGERAHRRNDRLWQHASAVLAQTHFLVPEARRDVPDLARHVEASLRDTPIKLEDVEKAGDDNKALSLALQALSNSEQPLPPISIEATVAKGVTRVSGKVAHDTPDKRDPKADTVDEVANEADPRNWSRGFPDMFAKSYCIRDTTECVDRYEDPDVFDIGPTGTPWKLPFFETAQLTLGGQPAVVLRNVLSVDFRVKKEKEEDTRKGTIDLIYSLHEALSNSILGAQSPGGLDVDSAAEGLCHIVLEPAGERTHIETEISKSLRFSDDIEFSDELNVLCLPFLRLWIQQILMNAVSL